MKGDDHLFSSESLDRALIQRREQLRADIDSAERDYLLHVSETDFAAHLVSKYRMEVPVLAASDRYIDSEQEVQIEVGNDPDMDFGTRGPHYVKGNRIVVAVPFVGDKEVFLLRTNPWSSGPPRARVLPDRLLLTFGEGACRLSG